MPYDDDPDAEEANAPRTNSPEAIEEGIRPHVQITDAPPVAGEANEASTNSLAGPAMVEVIEGMRSNLHESMRRMEADMDTFWQKTIANLNARDSATPRSRSPARTARRTRPSPSDHTIRREKAHKSNPPTQIPPSTPSKSGGPCPSNHAIRDRANECDEPTQFPPSKYHEHCVDAKDQQIKQLEAEFIRMQKNPCMPKNKYANIQSRVNSLPSSSKREGIGSASGRATSSGKKMSRPGTDKSAKGMKHTAEATSIRVGKKLAKAGKSKVRDAGGGGHAEKSISGTATKSKPKSGKAGRSQDSVNSSIGSANAYGTKTKKKSKPNQSSTALGAIESDARTEEETSMDEEGGDKRERRRKKKASDLPEGAAGTIAGGVAGVASGAAGGAAGAAETAADGAEAGTNAVGTAATNARASDTPASSEPEQAAGAATERSAAGVAGSTGTAEAARNADRTAAEDSSASGTTASTIVESAAGFSTERTAAGVAGAGAAEAAVGAAAATKTAGPDNDGTAAANATATGTAAAAVAEPAARAATEADRAAVAERTAAGVAGGAGGQGPDGTDSTAAVVADPKAQPDATDANKTATTTKAVYKRPSGSAKPTGCCSKPQQTSDDGTYQPSVAPAPIAEQCNEPGHLNWRLNLRQFTDDEVKVHVDEGRVCVTAHHEERTDSKTVSLEYQNDMRLPEGLAPEAVVVTRQPDGMLSISASVPSTVRMRVTQSGCGATKCGPSDRVHCQVKTVCSASSAEEAAAVAALDAAVAGHSDSKATVSRRSP